MPLKKDFNSMRNTLYGTGETTRKKGKTHSDGARTGGSHVPIQCSDQPAIRCPRSAAWQHAASTPAPRRSSPSASARHHCACARTPTPAARPPPARSRRLFNAAPTRALAPLRPRTPPAASTPRTPRPPLRNHPPQRGTETGRGDKTPKAGGRHG